MITIKTGDSSPVFLVQKNFAHWTKKVVDNVAHWAYNEYRKRKEETERSETMYEVVKTVKGYEIKRMIGTHGHYHVLIREGKGFKEFHTFKTIKAAVEFIETAL